ncbi:hypothetical protein AT1219_10871 [Vibrio alginolyticus]
MSLYGPQIGSSNNEHIGSYRYIFVFSVCHKKLNNREGVATMSKDVH